MDFQADYEEIRRVSSSLMSEKREYDAGVRAIYEKVDQVSNSWQGADNQAFAQQVNTYKQPMQDLGAAIEECANFLNQVAAVIEETQNTIKDAAGRI